MRDVETIVATASTNLSYHDKQSVLKNISNRLDSIPHDLLVQRTKQDDLQLELDTTERGLLQLELAASAGIDNNGRLRAEEHLQDKIKKIKAKITSNKLETDRIRSEKCHLVSLQKDLQTQLDLLEQKAKRKRELILQEQEQAYRDNDVQDKAIKALSDFIVYSALRLGVTPAMVNIPNLIGHELQRDNALSKLAEVTYQSIVNRAAEVSYE